MFWSVYMLERSVELVIGHFGHPQSRGGPTCRSIRAIRKSDWNSCCETALWQSS